MKKILFIVIFIVIKMSLVAQLYQYNSNRVVITNVNTNASEAYKLHKIISLTIDNLNKKISMVDSSQAKVYRIVSTKTTKYNAVGTERNEYKCLDEKRKIQTINLVLYDETLQKQLHISGQFEITIGTLSYAYDLHKTISN